MHQTQYTQPALFALEYALAELWASWGVKPDIVLGHSVGEYAAACVAGVMSLEDGLRLIAERARLMQSVKRHGKMAVVFASRERVAKEIESAGGEVVIAVLNGPENIVISGDAAAVDEAGGQVRGRRRAGEAAQRVARVPFAADGRDARRVRAVCRPASSITRRTCRWPRISPAS